MNLDNILRTMNEYIKDMYDIFGGQSIEYSTAVRQVREHLSDEVLQQVARQGLDYKSDEPTEPLQLSRGKAAQNVLQNFAGDLQQLRQAQRETGTAKTQAQRYYMEQKLDEPDAPADLKNVKERASERYDFNSNVNDWYEAIDNAPELSEEEKEDIKEDYSTLNSDYADPAVRDNIRDKAAQLLAKIRKKRKTQETPIEAAPDAVGIGNDISKII